MTPRRTNEELAVAIQAGDKAARGPLIEQNEAFIRSLVAAKARRLRRVRLDVDSLQQAGRIGLLRAAEGIVLPDGTQSARFDPSRGLRFLTYAATWVRVAIQRDVAEQTGRGLVCTSTALRVQTGQLIEPGAMLAMQITSLDRPLGDEGRTFLDELESEDASPEEQTEASVVAARLAELAARRLTGNEREIYERRLLGGATLKEVGDVLGFSRERARQVETNVLRKLRKWALGDPVLRERMIDAA